MKLVPLPAAGCNTILLFSYVIAEVYLWITKQNAYDSKNKSTGKKLPKSYSKLANSDFTITIIITASEKFPLLLSLNTRRFHALANFYDY